jgi:hypothetical protein
MHFGKEIAAHKKASNLPWAFFDYKKAKGVLKLGDVNHTAFYRICALEFARVALTFNNRDSSSSSPGEWLECASVNVSRARPAGDTLV